MSRFFVTIAIGIVVVAEASAEVNNLKIVTDASPDYTDLPSLVHSVTSKWETPEEKCWAMFYWNHIARRQTNPMIVHGLALTDPIRQFNDYGFTMCSTISGINQTLYEALGLRHQFWDICNHTVSAVEYEKALSHGGHVDVEPRHERRWDHVGIGARGRR